MFKVGDSVVYPSHGVGQIAAEETQMIGGAEIGVYVIKFARNKMVLHIPKSRALKAGLRALMSREDFQDALCSAKKSNNYSRTMWNKRAQEYEQKINSGNVSLIAEVLRDLHRNVGDSGRSYSERVIYESALERLVSEYAIAANIEKQDARSKVTDMLDAFAVA